MDQTNYTTCVPCAGYTTIRSRKDRTVAGPTQAGSGCVGSILAECQATHYIHGINRGDRAMTEMVERIARVIRQMSGEVDLYDSAETVARAVIEAMRAPTKELIAGGESASDYYYDNQVPTSVIWKCMIDGLIGRASDIEQLNEEAIQESLKDQ